MANPDQLDDDALVAQVRAGRRDAFRQIMQHCNQRLFRAARAVIGDDSEAEDILQESYMRAYLKLDTFKGDSSLSTWLTSIVLNEARGRLRVRKRHSMVALEQIDATRDTTCQVIPFPARFGSEDPAASAAREQVRHLLERAIDELPSIFRVVYMLREVEQYSVEEVARLLDIKSETVKTRLHRANRRLRNSLQASLATSLSEVFPFMGVRCVRIIDTVMARLKAGPLN